MFERHEAPDRSGRRRGPAFAPWAGGFFGAGLLPGLFVASMLGGTFGCFGYPDAAYGEPRTRSAATSGTSAEAATSEPSRAPGELEHAP